MNKKVLITGATGFVGKNVKQFLEAKNYLVCSPNSSELNCLDENSVKKYLSTNKFDIILHFAVYGDEIDKSKDGNKILDYNLRMFLNFAQNHHLYDKMIYTGSGAEYDKRFPIVMVKEEDIETGSIPTDQYGLMKYTVNQMIEKSENIYNLRLFGIFGKYEYWKTKYISNLCCKSIKGLPLSLRQNCYFDYLWIEDFCRMLELFMELDKPLFHSYNAVSGKRVDLLGLAEIVNKISDQNQKIHICKDGYANEYTADNSRILKEIPEMRFTGIEEAIESLYQWYKENESEIDLYSLIYG